MIVDDGLELLTEEQCRQLLAGGEVGRVGITIGALPAIFPVNYRVVDGAIEFRTAPGTKLTAATVGAVVAFEADDYHLADNSTVISPSGRDSSQGSRRIPPRWPSAASRRRAAACRRAWGSCRTPGPAARPRRRPP